MKTIINMTQHQATPDQIDAGVVDFSDRDALLKAITIKDIPSAVGVLTIADKIVALLCQHYPDHKGHAVMIGGAPYLMAPLTHRICNAGYTPTFAYTKRVSTDIAMDDGSIQKSSVFKHAGFVPAVW